MKKTEISNHKLFTKSQREANERRINELEAQKTLN